MPNFLFGEHIKIHGKFKKNSSPVQTKAFKFSLTFRIFTPCPTYIPR